MAHNSDIALQRLRKIILQDDPLRVEDLAAEIRLLRDQFEDADDLLEKLDPVIADTLARKINESKDDMAEALAPIMGSAIKRQIQDAKEDVVDALYPVIGSTIRKSITEAMKNLTRTVNERIDRALSFAVLFRKLKSKMTGVSQAELLIKDALPFEVREIFLIHKESGILLQHISRVDNNAGANEAIVSGMLTAIRDFANTAFQQSNRHELHEIQYDDLQIRLQDGRYAYLALVMTGVMPDGFTEKLSRCEQKLHNLYYRELRSFNGDASSVSGSTPLLKKLLYESNSEKVVDEKPRKRFPWFFIILLCLILIAVFYYRRYIDTPAPVVEETSFNIVDIRNQLSGKGLNLAGVTFVEQDRILILNGHVASEQDKYLIGKAVAAELTSGVILNNITYDSSFEQADLLEQIENTLVLFPQNSIDLNTEAKNRLDAIVEILQRVPSRTVYLTGHSDIQGGESVNEQIALSRAIKVRDYLVTAGLDSSRFVTRSWGTRKPVASNFTKAGRAANRRVEFNLTDE